MEKESVKKFDLEAAFKALDEIEIPQTKGIKANRVDLKERFGHKPATETLVEDYYDVSSTEDLKDAKEERDGEIAKAKLARIEKIVDLNAESPEDLLPSYVGKVIMQCPQCMTLFYKNPEDIEPSEENPDVVNLNEPCQHCGNTSGYTLIGKVGAVTEDEADKYDETPAEENELDLDFGDGTEEVDAEGTGEGAEEMSDEETKEKSADETSSDKDLDLNLDEIPEEEPEEKKKEESLKESKTTKQQTIYHLFLDGKEVYESESIPLNKALSEITAYIKKLTPEQKKSFSLSWEFDESGYYDSPIYDNEGNIVGSRNDWEDISGDTVVGVFSEAECKEYGYAFPEDRFVVNVDYAGDAIRKALGTDVTTNLKEGKSKVKESKTTKQRLTVVEPGYQYKDKNGNIYTLYGDELEEDDTGIVYDWEFVDDENGDIYLKEEMAEESLNLSKEASENESEHKSENLTLNEEVDKDLDEKLKAHNDYIAYLQQMIKQEEEALKKAENDEIKAAIQRRLDAFNADLEAALPDAVKAEASVEETVEEPVEEETKTEEEKIEEPAEETDEEKAEEEAPVDEALTEEAKECKVVLSDKPEKEVFAGTKEECEKIIEKNKETKTAKEHGLKIVEPVADENKAEEKSEKSALKESIESEIDSIIASWGVKESLTEEGDLDRLLDSDEFKTPVSEEEINAARREVAKESLEEKCDKQKITEESDSEIAAIINSWKDAPEVPVEESCEGPECESKEDCNDCLKEEKEDEAEAEETDSSEDSEEVCFTTEEVKEVATDVAQSLATPVEDEEEAEKQAEEISEVVDEKVDKAIEEKTEEADEDEAEEADAEKADKEDKSDDEESKEETEEPEFNEDDIDELDEDSLNKHIDEYLKEVYSNVKSYETTDCSLKEGKLIVEGKISFNSGKEKLTMFEFLPSYCEGKLFFEGYNKDFSEDKAFTLNCSINKSKTLITESFGYKYKINENLVKGLK